MILKGLVTSSAGYLLQYETETNSSFTYCDTWRGNNIDLIIKGD